MAALLAALGWTLASGLWRRVPTSLGAAQLNLLKNLLALSLQLPLLVLLLERAAMAPLPLSLLLASGALGIAAGDSFYFAALRRLGTRRTLTFEAGGPAVTGAAGLVLLAEVPRAHQWAGILLVSLALVLVARQQPPQPRDAPAGADRGQPGLQQLGVLLALLALVCGSGGALLARAALRLQPISPLEASSVRLLGACVALLPLLPALLVPGRWRTGPAPAARRWPLVLAATLLGTTAGIALQQLALQRLPAGLAVALLATAPLMAVPLAPLEGDRPGPAGWLAAALGVLGVGLLVR
ncbi:EamA family transporter [Cyanobium sp. CH-040]|uniref:EamA family transporter n=1 Tax=Cyanobium sp. CH-040 TaxID=2823708 RepID=UPI0020CFD66A|nr:EamA family transporter [Cyanobium sp. CH-040]